jgi:uncharacterized protein YukE
MGRFAVDTGQMSAVSARGAELSSHLTELRGQLDVAGSSASAAGASDAVAAIEGCCTSWSSALGGLADVVASLGTNLSAAARAYEITDGTAIGER